MALILSVYMTFYTENTPKRVQATPLIHYSTSNAAELASIYAEALGDGIIGISNSTYTEYCTVHGFDTALGNIVEVGYCGHDLRYLTYSSIHGLAAPPQPAEEIIVRVVEIMTGIQDVELAFSISVEPRPEGFEAVRAVQTIGKLPISWSGFQMLRDPTKGLLKTVTLYNFYIFPDGGKLPNPDYGKLSAMISGDGVEYHEPYVTSLGFCGGWLTYNVAVRWVKSPALGYNAMIDIHDGTVLSLVSLSPIGSYRLVSPKC